MSNIIIGVMGPSNPANKQVLEDSYLLGKLVAQQGWILLTGGQNLGVMTTACKGAKSAGGQTIGIIFNNNTESMSPYIDIPIITDLGCGRNNVNVLTSTVVVACGMSSGTASEVCLALNQGKAVVLMQGTKESDGFFLSLNPQKVHLADNPHAAFQHVMNIVHTRKNTSPP